MKIQSRDIPHKSEVGGVRVNITTKGEAFSAYRRAARQCAKAPARCGDPGRAGRPDGEKGRRDHRRHADGRDLRADDHGRPRRHHHGTVPRRDLPAGAGERGGSVRDAGRAQGRAAAQRISRGREGRCCGAVAIDLAGVGAGGAARARDFGDRAQPGAGARGRAGRHDRRCAGGARRTSSACRPGERRDRISAAVVDQEGV